MDKGWVDEHNRRNKEQYDSEISCIRRLIKERTKLTDEEINLSMLELQNRIEDSLGCYNDLCVFFDVINSRKKEYEDDNPAFANFLIELLTSVREINIPKRCRYLMSLNMSYDRYLDSECVEFDGDIIITDPCYLMNDDDMRSGYDSIKSWGLSSYMTRDTMCGDWSCNTVDSNTGEAIGEFCADGGEVGVFLLNEILRHNPEFNYHKERNWTTTLIENFKGTVQFVVQEIRGTYESTSEYFEKGEEWVDYYVQVIGHGINKYTGKPIDFHTSPVGW